MKNTASISKILVAGLAVLPLIGCGAQATDKELLMGADLSYVNEMEDCGATYRMNGRVEDPYKIFQSYGANIVRLRLWHNPEWTAYSTLDDVKKSIGRAKGLGMKVLLAPHYSDDWADPSKQTIPKAWAAHIDNTAELSRLIYEYTYDLLLTLNDASLLPEIVQVGNEINGNILRAPDTDGEPIDWPRNAELIRSGIKGIRDAGQKTGKELKVLLHIAQPENAERWFKEAVDAGVNDFDYIGISYYEKWSDRSVPELGETVKRMRETYNAEIVIVETSYPWTLESVDEANNILGEDSLVKGYPATPAEQKRYLIDLTQTVVTHGASGVIYWEPAWVSTPCKTRWGQGSHWENATLFDFSKNNEVLEGIEFLRYPYRRGDRETGQ